METASCIRGRAARIVKGYGVEYLYVYYYTHNEGLMNRAYELRCFLARLETWVMVRNISPSMCVSVAITSYTKLGWLSTGPRSDVVTKTRERAS